MYHISDVPNVVSSSARRSRHPRPTCADQAYDDSSSSTATAILVSRAGRHAAGYVAERLEHVWRTPDSRRGVQCAVGGPMSFAPMSRTHNGRCGNALRARSYTRLLRVEDDAGQRFWRLDRDGERTHGDLSWYFMAFRIPIRLQMTTHSVSCAVHPSPQELFAWPRRWECRFGRDHRNSSRGQCALVASEQIEKEEGMVAAVIAAV